MKRIIIAFISLCAITGYANNREVMKLPPDTIFLSGPIDKETAIDVEQVMRNKPSTIHLYLNSPGGLITAGLNILNSLGKAKHIHCYIESAHSMAFVVMTYCDTVVVTPHSYAIQHEILYMYKLYPPLVKIAVEWYSHQADKMGITFYELTSKYYENRDYTWFGDELVADGMADVVVDGFNCDEAVKQCKIGVPYGNVSDVVKKRRGRTLETTWWIYE